jgi:glycine/D-amino acid oxidase-like deaminating enzyme
MMPVSSGKNLTIVGGGIIGLCSAFHLLKQDWNITLITSDRLDDTTACGSAGAIAMAEILPASRPGLITQVPRWLLDPLGPLSVRFAHLPQLSGWLLRFLRAGNQAQVEATAQVLANLMSSTCDDHFDMIKEIKAQHLLQKNGALYLYHSEHSRDRDARQWAMRRQHGIGFTTVNKQQILEREPALGRNARCGYFVPDWCHYMDPQALLSTLGNYIQSKGVAIIHDTVSSFEFTDERPCAVVLAGGNKVSFDSCLVAAGARSALLSAQLDDRFPLESERGYNTVLPNSGLNIKTYLAFEEHFVLTPMAQGLRIGGAAEFAGLDAPPNYARSKALVRLAKRYLPDLNEDGGTQWMGQRPSTPDSRPVISASTKFPNIFYGFGHGHLGLTFGPTTGRLLSQLISGKAPQISLSPFAIDRYS